jgi:hypothetical protein
VYALQQQNFDDDDSWQRPIFIIMTLNYPKRPKSSSA